MIAGRAPYFPVALPSRPQLRVTPVATGDPGPDADTLKLAVMFVLVYCQGFISERVFGISRATGAEPDSAVARLLTELAIVLALTVLVRHRRVVGPPGLRWFICYAAACLISACFSTDSLLDGFLYCRYTVYALGIYAVGCTMKPGRRGMPCERLLAALFALQLLASVVKTLVLADRTEWRVGTMLISGGSTATIFPLLALGFTMGYYLYVRRSFWVLLAGLSFGLIGYASGKRTILFILPIFVCVNILLYCVVQKKGTRLGLSTLSLHLFAVSCLGAPALLLALATSHGVALKSSNASVGERLEHALQFAEQYETNSTARGNVSGRLSASGRVLERTSARPIGEILLGWGPAALMPKRHLTPRDVTGFKPYGIQYGIAGWSRDLISSGVFATLFLVLAYGAAMRNTYSILLSTSLAPRLKAVAFGTFSGFIVFFYAYFMYTFAPLTNGTITFVLLFCAGFLHSIARQQSSSPSPGLHTLRPRLPQCAS